jgi:hypothetical protein
MALGVASLVVGFTKQAAVQMALNVIIAISVLGARSALGVGPRLL